MFCLIYKRMMKNEFKTKQKKTRIKLKIHFDNLAMMNAENESQMQI